VVCTFTEFVGGNAGDTHTNVATGTGVDDDGNDVSDSDDETVTINDVPSSIDVVKTANPTSVDEPGADVTFTVTVTNTSVVDDVTINSVVDDTYGDISSSCAPVLPATLAPTEVVTCTFTEFIGGNAGDSHTNVATGFGVDDDGNEVEDFDDETVTILGVDPSILLTKTADPTTVNEPGGDVTFTVVIENTSASSDPVTINSLIDDIHGDLNGQGDCSVPQLIEPDESYTCSFTAYVAGNAGDSETDTVTGSGTDDDGTPVSDSDDATVTILDVKPAVSLTKSVLPATLSEPGGVFTYTLVITNDSVETVTIDALSDDYPLSTGCTGLIGTPLGPGDSTSCTYEVTHSNAGTYDNTASVTVSDDEGNTAGASDDASVIVTDVLPLITVVKTANPENVVAPGENVTFTIEVTNNSVESDPVTLTSLTDDIYGDILDLTDEGGTAKEQISTTCALVTIAANDTYTCNFVAYVGLENGVTGSETDTVTVSGNDDEGNPTSASDQATVTISPPISVTNSSLCIFDNDNDPDNGRQWRRLFTQDVQNWPSFKFNATNPGQFFYNLSVSGTPGTTVTIDLEIPWPFVTQGAKALHVYDGVTLYTNDAGETCYMPGNETDSQGVVLTLGDYPTDPVGFGYPGRTPVTKTISVDIIIPSTGFAYVNQHMDDGLKGPHVDADNDGVDDRYDQGSDVHPEDAVEKGSAPNYVVLMPELTDHTFCTYTGGEQLGCDSVQNDNDFKKNPGVAGRGAKKPKDEFGNPDPSVDPQNGEPVVKKWVKLYAPYNPKKGCSLEWCEIGRSQMNADGYYQIVYKHLGRPTDFRLAIVEDQDSDITDLDCENAEKIINLKGNEFEEHNYLEQPESCKAGPSGFPGS
jgi:uncharacterized repeat protein (TIGR01451 family)